MMKEIETGWGKVLLIHSAATLITIRWYHNDHAAATIPAGVSEDDSTVMPAEILATYCAPESGGARAPLPSHVLETVCSDDVRNWLRSLRGALPQPARF
jgi:hypothetical protein